DRIDQRDLPLDHTYRHSGSGRGVTIYVFDGGVSLDHPELAGRVRRGFSAFPEDPAICNAHGTAVAGAIAGKTLGVAPDAEIVDGTIVVGASALVREGDRGASDPIDRRAPGTAWGPCVDLYAPGDSVLLPSLDKDQSPTVQLWNGTSMSAGYVSGAAALYLE